MTNLSKSPLKRTTPEPPIPQMASDEYYQKNPQEFMPDFLQYLVESGVPAKYAQRVADHAWQEGHAHGYYEIVNVAQDLIYIFEVDK